MLLLLLFYSILFDGHFWAAIPLMITLLSYRWYAVSQETSMLRQAHWPQRDHSSVSSFFSVNLTLKVPNKWNVAWTSATGSGRIEATSVRLCNKLKWQELAEGFLTVARERLRKLTGSRPYYWNAHLVFIKIITSVSRLTLMKRIIHHESLKSFNDNNNVFQWHIVVQVCTRCSQSSISWSEWFIISH